MARFLSKEGFKYFVEKVIGKADISEIADGTLKGAVSDQNQTIELVMERIEDLKNSLNIRTDLLNENIKSVRKLAQDNQSSIDNIKNSINTTNANVDRMNYASVSQIEGTSTNVSIDAGKKGTATVVIGHAANISLVGIGALTVSSGYVVISGWNRNTVNDTQDIITVDLYNTTASAKTVTVKVEGRYVKSLKS